ncbi:MAG: iron-sulfur cluster assembly scaffold protein [Patescibacteria group bacterium]|nr:MAG: iron-sulfur cluster assembly scaffold protein [Patescibacteria group bacterium]
MSNLYSEIILDHYQNPRNFGKLDDFDKKVEVANSLCGDRLTLYLKFENEKVKDVRFEGIGCAISKASSSMLTEAIKGKTKNELKKIDKNFIIKMLGVELGVNRIKCALLSLEALKKAII